MTFQKNSKSFLFTLSAVVIILFAMRFIVSKFFDFNSLIDYLNLNFQNYGPVILFLCGLLEGLIIIGLYFPGSTIILLGATLAGVGTLTLWSVVFWTTLGLTLAYVINYYLGRKGGEKFLEKIGFQKTEKVKNYIEKSKLVYLWITIHPNLAAVGVVITGVLKINPAKALLGLIVGQILWSTIWGLLFFYFGKFLFDKIAFFIVAGMTIAIIWEIIHMTILRPNHNRA